MDVQFDPLEFANPRQQRVIGTGAYGCVIWPALIFYNSKNVTNYNSEQCVTKIARDANDEYDIGLEILKRTSHTVGIFPIDPLVCGIAYKDVKPFFEQAGRNCKTQFGDAFFHESLRKQAAAQTRVYKPLPMRSRFVGGAQGRFLCAVQYQKYDRDLYEFSKAPLSQDKINLYKLFKKQLEDKQDMLHDKNIVHLDIKLNNLCELNGEAYFADWGMATFLDTRKDLADCLSILMQPKFKAYFLVLMPSLYFRVNSSGLYVTYKNELEDYYSIMVSQSIAYNDPSKSKEDRVIIMDSLFRVIIALDRLLLAAALKHIRITLPQNI